MHYPVTHSEDEWLAILGKDRFRVLRGDGTEPPFNNAYWDEHRDGAYRCGGCATALFDSAEKYDSGTGWPSFARPVSPEVIEWKVDNSGGMIRTEAICANCGGHLGHVFHDGPPSTGLRYCMNSLALVFEPRSG
jgi:peptide-methionine (R)-S-oxide reductase